MRKLAITSISMSIAVFLAYYLLPFSALFYILPLFAVSAVAFFFLRRKARSLYCAFLICLGAAIGFGSYCFQWNRTLLWAELWNGDEQTANVRVLEYPQAYSHYTRVHVERTEAPRLGMMLYDYNGQTEDLRPGDLLQVRVKLRRADLRYGERNDSYVSKDIYLTGTLRSVDSAAESRRMTLRTLAAVCSRRVSDYAASLFSEDTQAFLRSLMLGDKTDFYQDLPLYAAMRGAGFMHIVAVSGMHIAFLVGILQLLFGARPASSVFGILLVWCFVFLTGASPSAVRAGIMQTVLLFAPIVRRENDGPTSLSFALALILLFRPFSCASISLQLSFSAMAGMILLAEPLNDAILQAFRIREDSFLRTPAAILASSLAVLICSTPFSVLHFGTLAVWSPLTNLLGLWAVPICFCGAWLSCALSLFSAALGSIPARLTELLAHYLIGLAKGICRLPHPLLGMQNPALLLWLLFCYGMLLIAWRSRGSLRLRVLGPLTLSVLSLIAILYGLKLSYRSGDMIVAALDVGQGECVCVLSGEQTVMLDCGSSGLPDAGETAGLWLGNAGRRQIDLLVLSHLHEDHCNGVPMLLELIPVRQILLSPDADRDENQLPLIRETAARHGTEIVELSEDRELELGKLRLQLFAPGGEGSENERCVISLVSTGEYDMLFMGDSLKKAERELVETHSLPDTELLIVGHHGSSTSTGVKLLDTIQAEEAIICVGKYNSYGHPTQEVLDRLAKYGYHIRRTDLEGTVELRIGA